MIPGFHFDLILAELFLISLKKETMVKMKAVGLYENLKFIDHDWGL